MQQSAPQTRVTEGMLVRLYFAISLIFAVGAFTNQLAGADPRISRSITEGAPLAQAVNATIYIIAVYVFLRSKIWQRVLARAWPIFLLPGLAIISALWAPDVELTLRRSMALLGSAIFGLSLATTYDFKSSLQLLIRVLVVVMALSVVWVIVFPQTGIHQASDILEPIHAGKWRGVFAHKNSLGAIAGISVGLTVLFGRVAFQSTIIRIVGIAISGVCLVFANSATGFSIALILIATGFAMSLVGKAPRRIRVLVMLYFFLLLVLLSFFSSSIENVALAVLGKDPDLTGRTIYWSYVLPFMENHWTLGHGYFSGFVAIGAAIASATEYDLGETHNGYIDVLVSFGIVGLVVAGFYLLWVLAGSLRFIVSDSKLGNLKTFPFCAVVYTLQHNLVESAALAGNSLYPLILVLAAVMMVRHDVVNGLPHTRRFKTKHAGRNSRALHPHTV